MTTVDPSESPTESQIYSLGAGHGVHSQIGHPALFPQTDISGLQNLAYPYYAIPSQNRVINIAPLDQNTEQSQMVPESNENKIYIDQSLEKNIMDNCQPKTSRKRRFSQLSDPANTDSTTVSAVEVSELNVR